VQGGEREIERKQIKMKKIKDNPEIVVLTDFHLRQKYVNLSRPKLLSFIMFGNHQRQSKKMIFEMKF
jgi:hypothetical protein